MFHNFKIRLKYEDLCVPHNEFPNTRQSVMCKFGIHQENNILMDVKIHVSHVELGNQIFNLMFGCIKGRAHHVIFAATHARNDFLTY